MKKIVLTCVLGLFTYSSFAQKVEKYCTIGVRFRNKRIDVYVDLGNDKQLFAFKDTTIRTKMLAAKNYGNTVDVLNYMASLGWTLISTIPNELGGIMEGYTFFLKRTFDQSEIEYEPKVEQNSN